MLGDPEVVPVSDHARRGWRTNGKWALTAHVWSRLLEGHSCTAFHPTCRDTARPLVLTLLDGK